MLTARIRPETRAKLEQAAAKHGRSLSQEIEHRLHRSFIEDSEVVTAFGSRKNFAIMRMAAATIEPIEALVGNGVAWTDDPLLFDQVAKAIARVLDLIRPHGELEGDSRSAPFKISASNLVEDVKNADLASYGRNPRERLAARIRADLGPAIVERAQTGKATVSSIAPELLPYVDEARDEGISVLELWRQAEERKRTGATKNSPAEPE